MVELIVSSHAIDQQSSELTAVGFFQDQRPLRSEVGLIDSRMGGLISSRLAQGFMTGQFQEMTLIPANGRIGADKILLIGLGETLAFCYGRVRELTEQVVKTCVGLQVYDLAMAFPNPLDFGLDWTKLIEAMMEGICLGLERGEPPRNIRLRLSGGLDHYDQIVEGVETARKVLKNPFHVKVSRDS
jgi:hypothetical protein